MVPVATILAVGYMVTNIPGTMPTHALVCSHRATSIVMKDWSRRKTLAEIEGGAGTKGAAAVGLVGTIPVVFEQGAIFAATNSTSDACKYSLSHCVTKLSFVSTKTSGNETTRTMAIAGQPLKEVAAQAGQYIKYQCGKGECGTCEVCALRHVLDLKRRIATRCWLLTYCLVLHNIRFAWTGTGFAHAASRCQLYQPERNTKYTCAPA